MTGAAEGMRDSLLINTNNYEQIANAIKQAIHMPLEEQIQRNKVLQKRLKRYNVEKWAQDFMSALKKTRETRIASKSIKISSKILQDIIDAYKSSKKTHSLFRL